MRTTLIASVVLTSLAGATAAGMMMSTSPRGTGTPVERVTAPQASTSPVRLAPALAPAQTATIPPAPSTRPVPVATSAPPEAARPPVPLRLTHKPPIPEKSVSSNSTAGADTPETANATAGQKSQQAARAAIEADGYRGVQILSQGDNGVWKASALRGKTRVVVNVDQAGNVFTE